MLLRQIPLAQCPEGIARRFCNRLAPVTQIFGESLLCRLDDQRLLVGKLLVKAAMRQASGFHKTHDADPVITSRSEEHTSELQSLMRISYAVFCLKKKTKH